MRWLALALFALPSLAQVLLIEGESAFVVPPGASVDLRVVLSSSSLGGNVANARVEFLTRQGSFAGGSRLVTQTDAAGRAAARFTAPSSPGFFAVDAAAASGDGAIVSFAFTVTEKAPPAPLEQVRANVRRDLLRNAADGSTLQLVGPWLLPAGTEIRPALWSKDKLAGGLWRTQSPSWFFWVDDGPAKSWAKPTRYYLLPVDGGETRIAGEMWWPLIRSGQEWIHLGRATSYLGNFISFPHSGSGNRCQLLWGNDGQPGAQQTLEAARDYFRGIGFVQVASRAQELSGCQQTRVILAAAASAQGVFLNGFVPWIELSNEIKNLGEIVFVIETNHASSGLYWWTGLGLSASLLAASDAERIGYVHPLQGGYIRRGLLPALGRSGGDLAVAVQESLRGELVVSSPRPRFEAVPAGPRRFALVEVEFSKSNQLNYQDLPSGLADLVLTNSDSTVADVAVRSGRLIVQAKATGRTLVTVSGSLGGQAWQGQTVVSVGQGVPTLRGCLIVAGQTQCIGQHQRRIPVAEDEVGGHVFLEVEDESVATSETKQYTYNRGERNIPLRISGRSPGRTMLKVRSHDGNALADIPIYVAAQPSVLSGVVPSSCPVAATFRTTFELAGGDTSLFEPFGGAWWGSGITLVFRSTSGGNFELRASGASEGQFFSIAGTLNPDCSFIGSGQGVVAQRITTAQVRGRIQNRNGVFDLMNLDYSIGVDGVFPRPIEYRGTGTLQDGCRYQIVLSENLKAAGGIVPVGVSSPALCPWTASGSQGATILAGHLGFGPGVVWLEIPANPGPAREFVVEVSGQVLRLNQPGPAPLPELWVNPVTGGALVAPGNALMRANAWRPFFLAPRALPLEANVSIEPSAPGILRVSGEFLEVNGLAPGLPFYVEAGGRERRVISQMPLGWGVERLELDGPIGEGDRVVVRQGGRSAQRGALRM